MVIGEKAKTPLERKLEALAYCITHGWDEDAEGHIFDLLKGLRCKNKPDDELTVDGLARKAEWKRHND